MAFSDTFYDDDLRAPVPCNPYSYRIFAALGTLASLGAAEVKPPARLVARASIVGISHGPASHGRWEG